MPSGPPHPDDLPTPERCEERARELDAQIAKLDADRAELVRRRDLYRLIGGQLARHSTTSDAKSARSLPLPASKVTRQEHGRQMGRSRRKNADSDVYRWLDKHGCDLEWLAAECARNGYRTSVTALKAAIRGAMGDRPYPAPKALRRAVERVTGGAVGDAAWPLHAD